MRLNQIVPGYVHTVSDFLTRAECLTLLADAYRFGYGDSERPRDDGRVVLQRPALARQLWRSLRPFVPRDDGGWLASGLNERFCFHKYEPGRRFAPHADPPFERSEDEVSRFTLLVYLNDDFGGGATRFRRMKVNARQGMALLFRHELEHEAARVHLGRKHVLRTDVMYRSAARATLAQPRSGSWPGSLVSGRHPV